jgi:hypothetical protein
MGSGNMAENIGSGLDLELKVHGAAGIVTRALRRNGFVWSDSGFEIEKSTIAREDEKGQDRLEGRVGLPAEALRSSAEAASPGRCRAAAVC